ncbi:SsgA family sporulation/cell division regulator [Streptomyces collinus]|uniref:SsgA family sporulation/cell division regulator n=1 Tax=Streptomyces collinus TaxID=42684 RepID=UPI003806596D
MEHLAATDEEFDALLDASSLGAPHVVAETGDIPATARHRMAQALNRQQRSLDTPQDTEHTRRNSEASSDPAKPASEELAAAQEARVMPWRPPLRRTGWGKYGTSAAYWWWHNTPSGAGRTIRHRHLMGLPWIKVSSADPRRTALRLLDALDATTRARRPRLWMPCNDGMRLSSALDEQPSRPLSEQWADAALRSPGHEALLFTSLWPQAAQLSRGIHTGTPLTLHAWAWPWTEQKAHRLPNLRQLVEPSQPPEHPALSVTPTGLFVYLMPSPRLRLACFTSCAYTAVGSGLLVPKTDCARWQRRRTQQSQSLGRHVGQSAGVSRTKLRRALVNGAQELSAELPMLFHFDERESLTLTSSLHTRLTYRVSDPYAVEARFRVEGQRETVWIFARDLLRTGLERKNGLGDVTVWPGTGTPEERRVFVRLSSPEGCALLSAAEADVRVFLEAGSNLVAYGGEHEHLLPALNALEATIGELARPGRCD